MVEVTILFNAPPASNDPDATYSPEAGPPVVCLRFEVVPRVGELLHLDAGVYRVGVVEHRPGARERPATVSLLIYEAVAAWP